MSSYDLCTSLFILLFASRSTKGIKILSQIERKAIQIGTDVLNDISGMMLSDGHIALRSVTANARFMFVLPSPSGRGSGKNGKTRIF